jgi:hypothetical protein
VQEELNLKPVFRKLQDDGIIKKNVNIKDIDDESIKESLTEQIADSMWKYIVREMGSIRPKQGKMIDTEFYCSEWR